jgi:type III restriction enzyme
VAQLQCTVQSGRQRSAMNVDELRGGGSFEDGRSRTLTEANAPASGVRYDLLAEITEKTQLTRRTAAAILRRLSPATFAKFGQNPEQFITEAARLINEQKATVIIEHLTYDTLSQRFDTSIFTENQTVEDFSKAGAKLRRHIYEYIVTDSKAERAFVRELDKADEVAVYAKLPRGFAIPTPVGDYNPDWAIAFTDGRVKHVYFVAETKGSMSTMDLRGVEKSKIDCARRFFARLAEHDDQPVSYDVVTDYDQLMQLVSA